MRIIPSASHMPLPGCQRSQALSLLGYASRPWTRTPSRQAVPVLLGRWAGSYVPACSGCTPPTAAHRRLPDRAWKGPRGSVPEPAVAVIEGLEWSRTAPMGRQELPGPRGRSAFMNCRATLCCSRYLLFSMAFISYVGGPPATVSCGNARPPRRGRGPACQAPAYPSGLSDCQRQASRHIACRSRRVRQPSSFWASVGSA